MPVNLTCRSLLWMLIGYVGIAVQSSLAAASATGHTIYVATDGNDASDGSKNNPLQSFQAGRDHAARFLREHPEFKKPVTVYFRGGIYPQTKVLRFTPEHSGRKEAPITFAAYPNEKVVISGGQRMTGKWQKVAGKPYHAIKVPHVFHRLYVNEESRIRARTPNIDEKLFRADGRVPGWDELTSMRFYAGDIKPEWKALQQADIIFLMTWTAVHHQITKIDFEKRGLKLVSPGGQHQLGPRKHFRYYIANHIDGLDQPGEWYLDPATHILYYYFKPGETPENAGIYMPKLKGRLVSFDGDPVKGKTISHLHFKGITFAHTDTDRKKWDGVYRQAHAFLDAMIYAKGLVHSSFKQCTIRQTGEYAMELAGGCQHLTIEACHLFETGGGGIQLGATSLSRLLQGRSAAEKHAKGTSENFDSLHNTIQNCIIHKMGTYWHAGYAINNRFASFSRIRHNEIFDTHYIAIAVDARWRYKGETYCHGNELSYNHLHHIGRRLHSDGAAMYQFGPTNNHYHHNLIHDVYAYPHVNQMKGIYLDQQSRNVLVEKNLVYNIEGVGLNQNWGMNNTMKNNLVAFSKGGAKRGKADKPESAHNHLKLIQNVFVSKDGVGLHPKWPVSKGKDVIEDNLFYDINHKSVRMWGKSFNHWRKETGHGKGIVIADPGCKDLKGLDFRIEKQNAALKQIGFVPFSDEIKKAGLYGDKSWTQLPKSLKKTIRPLVPAWSKEDVRKLGKD